MIDVAGGAEEDGMEIHASALAGPVCLPGGEGRVHHGSERAVDRSRAEPTRPGRSIAAVIASVSSQLDVEDQLEDLGVPGAVRDVLRGAEVGRERFEVARPVVAALADGVPLAWALRRHEGVSE